MANLSLAPADQLAKAVAARNKMKAAFKRHGGYYGRVYSSYNKRTGKIRMKFWYVVNLANNPKVDKAMNAHGFKIDRFVDVHGSLTSVVGIF